MSQPYYIYHISITDRDKVRITKHGPKQAMGASWGSFGYTSHQKDLYDLQEKARQNKLTTPQVQDFGQTLFEVLFDDSLRRNFLDFYEDVVRNKHGLLRLKLDIDESRLPDVAALPWELMRIPDNMGRGTVCLSTHSELIFSRWRARENPPHPIRLPNNEQLRVILAVATPSRSGEEKFGKVEYKKIWQRLEDYKKANIIDASLVKDATMIKLDGALETMKPHIFHFIGHAHLLKNQQQRDEGEVALTDEVLADEAFWVEAKVFSDLINRHQPHVVFLQACESGALSASEAFAGIASRIVEQNVPVVIAMQYKISNAVAQSFALNFYLNLIQKGKVDVAVQQSRRLISHEQGSQNRESAAPVLFMCVDDGQLLPSNMLIGPGINWPPDPKAIYIAKVYKYYLKLRKILKILQDEHTFFSREKKIGKDRCKELEKMLMNVQKLVADLHSLLDKPPKVELRPRFADTAELNHTNDILISLLKSLKEFCPQCPPPLYNQGRDYDQRREGICDLLRELLNKVDKVIFFLRAYSSKV